MVLVRRINGAVVVPEFQSPWVINGEMFFALIFVLALASSSQRVNAEDESFLISLRILAPITLTESQSLSFSNSLAGSDNDVVILPTSGEAAKFSASGEADYAATGSIIESSIVLTTGEGTDSTEQITIDTFVLGGDMSSGGNLTFDSEGSASNLNVGGTAHILAEDIIGAYSGAATFRLVYN
ncbi:MAG: hypothetical protein COB51_12845 [Moraxellaceae bacterium]|nr:MAG: hypothetical protein COB51_12845 [Moraxellaceae bacterium]